MAMSLVSSACFSLRNILTLPKYASVIRLNHNILDVQESVNHDMSQKLLLQLQENNNPMNLISIMQENKNKIDSRHIILALTSMQKFYQNSGLKFSQIHQSAQFINMCSILKRHLITLDLQQTIQAIKVLNLLQVSSNTMIMQSLLQLLRTSINDLSLREITFLSFLCPRMKRTPLNQAILKALPALFVTQLQLQLDTKDIKELKNAIKYVCLNVKDTSSIDYIINALNNFKEEIDVKDAMTIYMSISNLNYYSDNLQVLFDRIQEILINDMDKLESKDIYPVLLKTVVTPKSQMKFYNSLLVTKYIKRCIEFDIGFDKATLILNLILKVNHIDIPLLDYLANKCIVTPTVLSQCRPLSIADIVSGMSNANYKPPHWDTLQKIILNNYRRIPDDVTLCYFTLNLLSLDCFDSRLIEYVFTLDIKPEFISFNYYKVIQKLHQNVKTLYPAYTGPWLSEKIIKATVQSPIPDTSKTDTLSLLPEIEKIVGGPAHVHTNVQSSLGHLIDYLIILQDGNPIAVKQQSMSQDSSIIPCVDDFDIPPNAERIAVVQIPLNLHGHNIPRIQATALLSIKSLEAMSFTVVPVSMFEWLSKPDFERVPYLKRILKITDG